MRRDAIQRLEFGNPEHIRAAKLARREAWIATLRPGRCMRHGAPLIRVPDERDVTSTDGVMFACTVEVVCSWCEGTTRRHSGGVCGYCYGGALTCGESADFEQPLPRPARDEEARDAA